MARWRRPSLFWTIAGIFLLTVVVGTWLQGLVADAVLRPLEMREMRARAELLATSIGNEIVGAPRAWTRDELDSLLARHRQASGPRAPWVLFRASDGTIASSPRDAARFVDRWTGDGAARDSIRRSDRAGTSTARDFETGERPRGELRDSTRSVGPGDGGHGGDRGERRGRMELIVRRPVFRNGQEIGEVLVPGPARHRRGGIGPQSTRATLLFLPIAILASLVGGIVMIRLLVRRLRAMERLATRVAEGDFSVRIADRSGDEIGRLAGQLDRMTERLAAARDQLEAHDRQRRQLFADITHELATPLTSIRGYAETLMDPAVPVSAEERTRYVRGVLEESRRLDRMIRDLFELARLEAGATSLVTEPIDWAALVRHTLERFEPRFRESRLGVTWEASVAEAWIEADGHRIEQVLDNLLVNALRYVPAGGRVDLRLERGGADTFRLVVADDGPGLPPGDVPLVFERFYRGGGAARAAARQDQGGSGLGLAIVREIVERHGGRVRAEARAPHGLAIVIELPARR